MVEYLENEADRESRGIKSSFVFRNVYFLDNMTNPQDEEISDIPEFMHMMRHVYRSYNYTPYGHYIKCLHQPEKILIMHNHYPFGCLPHGYCSAYDVDLSVGHMQHYKTECTPEIAHICHLYKKTVVKDKSLWRWKERIIHGTTQTLKHLGFFN